MTPELSKWLAFVEMHAHDFTIQYPPRREYFMQNFRRTPAPSTREWLSDLDELAVYLHIPFCEAKCFYCNFAVDVSSDERIHRQYVDALLRELESHADWLAQRCVLGVDIGGGTPTRLPVSDLRRIANAIRPFLSQTAHPFPTSIETTPRICAEQPEKLAALRACGVDRVSLGVQSFNATSLASVNRRRQIDQTDHAVANLRAAGFPRINLDIIFALPGQSLADWKQDLERIIALSPDSVTTYDCLYRGQGRLLTKRTAELPSPETYGAMYDLAHEMLVAAGWHAPYGSVNFSRHSAETGTSAYFESRLLDGRPYLGLGNYATSLRDNFWSFNTQNTADYVARVTGGVKPKGQNDPFKGLSCRAKKGNCAGGGGIVKRTVMPYLAHMNDERREWFWKQFPGLVWSNSKAGDAVTIRAALSRPYENRLEAIGREFGMERLRQEWAVLCADKITPLA